MKEEKTYEKSWKNLGFFDESIDKNEITSDLPVRYSARAVLITEDNNFILSHSISHDAHCVPGGGIEEDETIEEATIRECKEETGYDVEFVTKLGYFKVHNEKFFGTDYLSVSFSYLVRAIGTQQELNLMDHEKSLGLSAECYSYEDSIKVLEEDIARTGNHYSVRSLYLMKEAKKYLDNLK